jgi:hypothetical protein
MTKISNILNLPFSAERLSGKNGEGQASGFRSFRIAVIWKV